MPDFIAVVRRLTSILRRRRLDAELREEMTGHIESRRQQLIAEGMDPGEAAFQARRQFGNVTAIAERARDARGFPALESFVQDLRYGARLLVRAPLFTLVAVLSIAFGLGCGLVIFTVTNAMILRPIADGGEDIYRIYTGGRDGSRFSASSYADYLDFAQARAFSASCAMESVRANMTVGTATGVQSGGMVSGGCFDLLRLRPHQGRLLASSSADEAVISYALWNRQFNADPAAVGASILVNGQPATIVGVAPRGFNGTSLDQGEDFWVPIERFSALLPPRALQDRRSRYFTLYARLRDGVSPSQAEAEVAGIARSLQQQDPVAWNDSRGEVRRVTVMKETEARFAGNPAAVPALLAGVTAIIIAIVSIACVNIATMLLARGAARTRELTIRLAIGASRGRLLRQLATESLLIAVLGAGLALAVIEIGIRVFDSMRPEGIPAVNLAIDWRVVFFAAIIALIATVMCGLLPGAHVVRLAIAEGMKGRAAAVRTRWIRAGAREALIVVQVTASVALLLVSTLFARGLAAGAAASPGFVTEDVATVGVDLGTTPGKRQELATRLLDRIAAVENVDRPAIAAIIPLTGSATHFRIGEPGSTRDVDGNVITPGYFSIVGMALRRGRDFTAQDTEGSTPVAIASETFAKTVWNTTDVVGRTLPYGRSILTIVGVVADVSYRSVSQPNPPLLYVPNAQTPASRFFIHARVRGGGETLAAMSAAARQVDPRIMIDGAMPMESRLDVVRVPERLAGWIGGAVGAVQFALVLMALWALVAYAVERRTREIGIRVALGATGAGVVTMLLRPALLLIATGAVLGSAAGLIGATVFRSEFIGLGELEPAAGIPAIVAMALVAIVAALVPARRATSVDPIVALRAE
jgi:predicted permease